MKLKAPMGGCVIRMYRHGLGDCFLLAFGADRGSQRYMLIDCGVLVGTENADRVMRRVVADIRRATGGHLDVLVATHEHWDHISGFAQARGEFERLDVDEFWLAWTEDPRNPLARELRNRRRMALDALRLALDKASAGGVPSLYAERTRGVAEFFGPAALGARAGTEETLDWAKQRWTKRRYCTPGGAPLKLPGLPNVRMFVLGPPTDTRFIRKSSPSRRGDEVYLDDASEGALGVYLGLLDAAPALPKPSGKSSAASFSPFNVAYHSDRSDEGVAAAAERYQADPWRRIETDWLGAAGDLALKLDAHTNNTSLVLAIELGEEGKVLLFPADAQVGSWLSWSSVTWTGSYAGLTSRDLLSRTVLYKVGHHGSHNATLSDQGLELMTSPDLAAMIPVNRKTAHKMRWRMPYEPLHDRLIERTLGRIILADAGLPIATSDAALQTFLGDCVQTKLYVDVKIQP